MSDTLSHQKIDWFFWGTWRQASVNTSWCLVGCSIGDFRTIALFQFLEIAWSKYSIMVLAVVNGLITSIALETIILIRKMVLKTTLGMSMISMLAMETSMNLIDIWVTVGARLTFWVLPLMLIAGFLKPLPYNYWQLKKWGLTCCS